MNILAVIGNESHTTSSAWSKMAINGNPTGWGDAVSKRWLTDYGDKHSRWCECLFQVNDGDTITIDAGANSGSRGVNRVRVQRTYRFEANAAVIQIQLPSLYGVQPYIEGRLVLVSDAYADAAQAHTDAKKRL